MDSIASRYAIALLSIAREENKIEQYLQEVENIIKLIKENPDFITLIKSYGLSKDEKKDALKTIFEGKIKEYILNLFYVLVDNKREKYILDVCNEFLKIAYKELNIKHGYVYSTIKLNQNQIKSLEQKVSNILKANVTLTNIIDKSLIGGFKIQVDDYIIEDSTKTRLVKLKESLKEQKGGNINGN